MNNSKQVLSLAKACTNQIRSASSAVKEIPSGRFQRLKEYQKRLGVDDGVPVYIKMGATDKILCGLTTAIALTGFGMCFETYYKLTFKD